MPAPTPSGADLLWGLALGGGVVAAGLATTWAVAEHASTGLQTAVAMPVDVAHLLAVACWLGGLAALLAGLRPAGEPLTGTAVRRFSRLASAACRCSPRPASTSPGGRWGPGRR